MNNGKMYENALKSDKLFFKVGFQIVVNAPI